MNTKKHLLRMGCENRDHKEFIDMCGVEKEEEE
jgi:hypothetical protein